MTEQTSWFMRQRRRLARWMLRFQPDPPLGGINANGDKFIDDGLDYLLPIVVPDHWPDDKKREAVLSSMREYGWTELQIEAAIDKRRNAIDNAVKQLQEQIDKEADPAKKARLQEASAPFMDQFSSPNQWEKTIPAWPTQDPLREWDSAGPLGTTSTRREILMRTHLAMERNPIAKTAVHMTTLFAMGDGLTLKCYNPEVERVLEEFRTNPDNDIESAEKSFCDTLQVDGELFIRFYSDSNGQTIINPLKPWEIWWIETERGFPRRPISYHWYSLQTNFKPGDLQIVIEDIPADEVLHITINRFAYEQRGRPDLFAILPWLKAYKDWLENRARQNFWRGALLWWVKLIGGTPTQVTGKRAQYKQPPPPGSIVVTNEKEEWTAIENKVNAGDAADDGRQIKLMSAIGKGLPEYMLSDGQNANLASASAQQLPALRTFGEYQDIMVNQVWRPIYNHVIQHALDAGLLPLEVQEYDTDGDPIFDEPDDEIEDMETEGKPRKPAKKTPKMISVFDAFDLEAPELESDDPKTLAESLQVAVTNGWISNETATGRMGFDYMSEQKKIEREEKESATKAYQGAGNPPVMGELQAEPPVIVPDKEPEAEQESVRSEPLQEVDRIIKALEAVKPTIKVFANEGREEADGTLMTGLTRINEQLETMTRGLNEMQVNINVPAAQPVINIEPTPIVVNPPEVTVNMQPAQVNVEVPAPIVNVENKVETPDNKSVRVVRDKDGNIKQLIKEQ